MNKNKIKIAVLIAAIVSLTGCASTDSVVKSRVNNAYKLSKSADGVNYGVFAVTDDQSIFENLCKAVNNGDSRCLDRDKYNVVNVTHAFGFAAASANTLALAPKDFPAKNTCYRTGDSKCTYVSVKSEKGKISTVLGVASFPGDGRCSWSGMPRAGGTVCSAYNWDYRKDMNDWSTTNGVMSVKESK